MTDVSFPLHIAVVQGSVRPGSYTAKAVALVADELAKDPDLEVDVIDPSSLDLPLPGLETHGSGPADLQARIASASGVVLATPEYHGSYSSVMKLVIENLGYPSALSGKPIALLGVAAGRIGAIKALEHLRSVASHIGGIVLPGPVSVANVRKHFGGGGDPIDDEIESEIRGVARNIVDYTRRQLCSAPCLEEVVRGAA